MYVLFQILAIFGEEDLGFEGFSLEDGRQPCSFAAERHGFVPVALDEQATGKVFVLP